MPEFPGYTGEAQTAVPVIKVKAVTHRKNPILQTCIGPSDEHTNLVGIPTEASILDMAERALPGLVKNVHCPSPGTGKYRAVLQIKKRGPQDEGRQRQAALIAFSAFSELKHVFTVDEDVDIFDLNDVIWAMTTVTREMWIPFSYPVYAVIRSTLHRIPHSVILSGHQASPVKPFMTAQSLMNLNQILNAHDL